MKTVGGGGSSLHVKSVRCVALCCVCLLPFGANPIPEWKGGKRVRCGIILHYHITSPPGPPLFFLPPAFPPCRI